MFNRVLWLYAGLALLALPVTASAQNEPAGQTVQGTPDHARLYLNPRVGIYMPMRPLVADQTLKMSNIATFAFGTSLGYRIAPRLALETSVTWTPSQVARRNWNSVVDIDAGIALAAVEVLALVHNSINSAGEQYAIYMGGGAAMVRRFGEAWEEMGSLNRPAGIASGIIRYWPAGSRFAFTGELQDVVSRASFRSKDGITHAGRVQHEVMLTVGAFIPLSSTRQKKDN
jgi:hypothetical protein